MSRRLWCLFKDSLSDSLSREKIACKINQILSIVVK